LAVSSIDATLDPGSLAASGLAAAIAKPIRQSRLLDAIVSALHDGGTLPDCGEALTPVDESLAPRPPATASGRILVAEDNEINQLVTCEILRTAGYACEVVASGSEAVKAVRRSHYALVLMDCQMPELDGFEATEWIRKLESRGELKHATGGPIPIIALTANAVQGDRERCLAAGMNDYATKPVDRQKLLAMVAKYVQGESPAEPESPSIAESTSARSIVAGDLLARCSGDATLAARLLVKFRDRLPDQGRQIAAAIATDRKQARQLAHALKGTAANMAAGSLSTAAAKLEQTLADAAADPAPSLRALDEQITRCLDDLAALLAEQPAAAPATPADLEHACAS
jgi:Amt family ammonium transporter